MEASTFSVTSDDGLVLFGYRWRPEEPKALVQIAHGMGEHAARYGQLAERLCNAGYAVVAHDQRGHGKSLLSGAPLGHMADNDAWNRAVGDIQRIGAPEASELAVPRFILGHSMGSFMTQQLLFQHPNAVAAAVLSASNGRPPPIAQVGRAVARLERLRLGPRGQSKVINGLSFEDFNKKFAPTRTDFDWLSRDEAEVDKYIADPLCGFIASNQSWVDMLDALPRLTDGENLARIPKNKPIYCFGGTRDAVGEFGRGMVNLVRSYRAAWLTEVDHKLYEDGRHEMLHETNRDEVIDDLIGWFDGVFTRLSDR